THFLYLFSSSIRVVVYEVYVLIGILHNCHSIGTPLATKPKLDVDLSGEPVDQSDYRSKIGSLMYLTSSRPNLVQAVCYCARYQARPTQKHLKEVKRIFKYLKGTINMGLWYPKDSGFELTAFSDADHAGCIDTRKSTSGGIQFLGDKLVSWMSKKQNCTAMSSAEAEYVALSASCAQVMWMRTQLKDYGFNYNKIPLYCDSQSAIAISCNPVQHSRTKHIHTRRIGNESLTPAELELKKKDSDPFQWRLPYTVRRNIRVILFSIHSDDGNLPVSTSNSTAVDNWAPKVKQLVKDIRSQDGKDDKDNDKGSKLDRQSLKEPSLQLNNEAKDQEHIELNDKSNLTDLKKDVSKQ
ncbi:hypothetical protein Tco_1403513, partial [Tanacetum coccineum]